VLLELHHDCVLAFPDHLSVLADVLHEFAGLPDDCLDEGLDGLDGVGLGEGRLRQIERVLGEGEEGEDQAVHAVDMAEGAMLGVQNREEVPLDVPEVWLGEE
jgi:hypothetical protein